MIKYTVVVAEQLYRDTQEAVFYKESLDTYDNNISAFAKKVATSIKKMETSPKIGSNLSLQIGIDTSVKYSVIG